VVFAWLLQAGNGKRGEGSGAKKKKIDEAEVIYSPILKALF